MNNCLILGSARQFILNLRAARSQIEAVPHGKAETSLSRAYLTADFTHYTFPTVALVRFVMEEVQAEAPYRRHEVALTISRILTQALPKFKAWSGSPVCPIAAPWVEVADFGSERSATAAEVFYNRLVSEKQNLYVGAYGEAVWQFIGVIESILIENISRDCF